MTQLCPLTINDLAVNFGSKQILRNISLVLEPKEFVTIMGENGAGKTVLIETLMGYHQPVQGVISFWGESFSSSARSNLNERIGWVLSHREDYPIGFSINDLFKIHRNAQPKWDGGFVRQLSEQFRLDTNQALSSVSLGEHSKVRLIKALAFRPELLVLDELTANLSPDSKQSILDALIERFSEGTMSVLYISHSAEEAVRLSDRVLWLTANGLISR